MQMVLIDHLMQSKWSTKLFSRLGTKSQTDYTNLPNTLAEETASNGGRAPCEYEHHNLTSSR